MKTKDSTLFIIILAGAILLVMAAHSYKAILAAFLAEWEGFSPIPYWDKKRYSWGYGTPAPGAPGEIDPATGQPWQITRAKAFSDAMAHVSADYAYLKPLISRKLSPWQWAAFLSFSYNLGTGNADNLVENINSGDDDALRAQWLLYDKANGQYDQDLEDRRIAEFDQLWAHS